MGNNATAAARIEHMPRLPLPLVPAGVEDQAAGSDGLQYRQITAVIDFLHLFIQ